MEKFLKIDLSICFECGEPKKDMHHIVPKSKGGKKTIPLCAKCHGLVHDKDFVKHRQLQKEGVERAKKRGIYKGRKKGTGQTKDEVLKNYIPIIKSLTDNPKLSLAKVAIECSKDMGKTVSPNTVRKVKNLLKLNHQ